MTERLGPGVHFDVPADVYHADPAPEPSLSSSIGKILLTECPYLAWREHPRLNPSFVPERSEKFDLGAAAHALTLHDTDRVFEIVDADAWRSNEVKAKRKAAWSAGKIPLLVHQYEQTLTMVKAGKPQFEKLSGGDPFINGKPEVTLIWEEGGIWCRARLDWLRDDRAFFPDFKWTATTVNPDDLPRHIYNMWHDFQEAFYRRGIIALGLHKRPDFRFYFQSEAAPYLVSPPMSPTPRAMDLADRKVERAMQIWRECRKTGRWPDYPKHVCHYDPPGYHEAQFEERVQRDAWIASEHQTIISAG